MAVKVSDKDRILDLLAKRGGAGATTFELRQSGYSGNPSQRIRELRAEGFTIEAEPFERSDGRRGKRYVLATDH